MKYVLGIAVLVAVLVAGWRILEPEVTNVVFQDELRDTAAQLRWRSGVAPPNSEEELRKIVIRKAEKHEIPLNPKQVTVQRGGTLEYPVWYIAVEYSVDIDLIAYSYEKHFNPTSKGGKF